MSTATAALDFRHPGDEPVSNLGRGVRIEGKLFRDQDLQVDGEVDGALKVNEHNLIVGPHARVKADIKAKNVTIVGTVEGTIEASDRIELCAQCRVVAQIKTRRIAIKDGAYFKGNIEVVQPKSVVAIRPTGTEDGKTE
jgi:cytoskeletal protein CcmA (bactofilin family)